jgi:hypothetical protein
MIGYVPGLEGRKLKLQHSDSLKNIMNSLGLLNRPCLCNASSWLATQYSSSIDPLVGNWSAGDNDNNIS